MWQIFGDCAEKKNIYVQYVTADVKLIKTLISYLCDQPYVYYHCHCIQNIQRFHIVFLYINFEKNHLQ